MMKKESFEKVAKRGIAKDGETLLDVLNRAKELTEATGCYFGLTDLQLTHSDPVKVDLLYSRLLSAVQGGMEACKAVAANPILREMPELCVAIFTPDGRSVAQSIGMAGHIPIMAQQIDWMIRAGYEDPEISGIAEGDLFCNNENIIAGVHPNDVCDMLPVFHDGELVAWVGTVGHESEIGAVSPGSLPATNTERFGDGLRICAEKIGTGFRISPLFEHRCRLMLRMPELFLMNRHGAIAANMKIGQDIQSIIAEFGRDFFEDGCRELIESERLAQINRVKKMTVPGRYRNVASFEQFYADMPVPPDRRKDSIALAPIDFIIEKSGEYTIDFDGAGAWGWHSTNAFPTAILGSMFATFGITIAARGTPNAGSVMPVTLKIPYDTALWPTHKDIATSMSAAPSVGMAAPLMSLQSRAFFSRGFREEVMLGATGGSGLEIGGTSQYGDEGFGFTLMDSPGTGGGGACAVRDGLDSALAIYLTEPDMGNCEVWETLAPVLWLGRDLNADWCGHGKYRGGYSITTTLMIYNAPSLYFNLLPGLSGRIFKNTAIFGGFPMTQGFTWCVKGADTHSLVDERKPLLHQFHDPTERSKVEYLGGEVWKSNGTNPTQYQDVLGHGDIIQMVNGAAAGGYGDPLERDPELARKDMNNGLLSLEMARKVYFIEASYDEDTGEYSLDLEGTRSLRDEERNRRLANVTTKQWWKERREQLLAGNVHSLIKDMYNDALQSVPEIPSPFDPVWNVSGGSIECQPKGSRWPGEFRAFWQLPSDFEF